MADVKVLTRVAGDNGQVRDGLESDLIIIGGAKTVAAATTLALSATGAGSGITLNVAGASDAVVVSAAGTVGIGAAAPGGGPGSLFVGALTGAMANTGIGLASQNTAGAFSTIARTTSLKFNESGGACNTEWYDGAAALIYALSSSGLHYSGDGLQLTPSYSWLNATTSGMFWSPGNSRIEWSVGNSVKMFMGNVGSTLLWRMTFK